MTIEMVSLPVFGKGVRVPFPRFGFEKKEGRATEKLMKSAEVGHVRYLVRCLTGSI